MLKKFSDIPLQNYYRTVNNALHAKIGPTKTFSIFNGSVSDFKSMPDPSDHDVEPVSIHCVNWYSGPEIKFGDLTLGEFFAFSRWIYLKTDINSAHAIFNGSVTSTPIAFTPTIDIRPLIEVTFEYDCSKKN